MQDTVLSVKNLCLLTGDTRILEDVSFSLPEKNILAVIGPNGAGKSSLLKGLSSDDSGGLYRSGGEVRFVGDLPGKNQLRHRSQHIAILPQHSLLNFPFLVEEVIGLGRLPHDTGTQRNKEIVLAVARQLDVENLLSRTYTSLSGGEKQRTQLARVLAQIWEPVDAKPRMLFLDEPLNSLDIGHQLQVMEILKSVAHQGVSIVTVLHDINIAARFADQLLALKNGRQLLFGSVEEVLKKTTLEQLYDVAVDFVHHTSSDRPLVVLGST